MYVEVRELTAQSSDDQQQYTAAEHLHAGGEQPGFRKLRIARPERSNCPRQGSENQYKRAKRAHVSAPFEIRRSDEYDDSDEAEYQPKEHCAIRSKSRRSHPLNDHEPKGKNRNQKCSQTRRNELLRPHHRSISSQQQKTAGDDRVTPVEPRRPRRSTKSRPQIEQGARDDETKSAHDEWRNRLDGVPDRKVGRSPHQIDRCKRSDYLRARGVPASVVQMNGDRGEVRR